MVKHREQKLMISSANMLRLKAMTEALEAYIKVRTLNPQSNQIISRRFYFPQIETQGIEGEPETQHDFSEVLERLILTQLSEDGRTVTATDNYFSLQNSTEAQLSLASPDQYPALIYKNIAGKIPNQSHAAKLYLSEAESGVFQLERQSKFKINANCQRVMTDLLREAFVCSNDPNDQPALEEFWRVFAELIEAFGGILASVKDVVEITEEGALVAAPGKEQDFRAYMTMASVVLDGIASVNEPLYDTEPRKIGAVTFLGAFESEEAMEEGIPFAICINGSTVLAGERNSLMATSFDAVVKPRYLYDWLRKNHPKAVKHKFPRPFIWPKDMTQQCSIVLFILNDNPYITTEMFSSFCQTHLPEKVVPVEEVDVSNVSEVQYRKVLARNLHKSIPQVEYTYQSPIEKYTLFSADYPEVLHVLSRVLILPTLLNV
jgi:hypothetical protein